MICNFNDELLNKLSIVNKSFVSIGKPIQVENYNVYVRDTILLAPQGYSYLKELSSLYESDFNKKFSLKMI